MVLYAFRRDDPRSEIAEALLEVGGIISVQILNEFVAVSRRKLGKNWEEIRFDHMPVRVRTIVLRVALCVFDC